MKRIRMVLYLMSLVFMMVFYYYFFVVPIQADQIQKIWAENGTTTSQIQEMLRDAGYYNRNINGVYDFWTAFGLSNYLKGTERGSEVAMVSAGSNTLYKQGSRGEVVKQIQRKLKEEGFYTGNIDGIFGYNTFLGVRKYQAKYKLKVDGIVGNETLKKMGITAGGNTNTGVNDQDVSLVAAVIHGEARGEPYLGKVAVGAVVLNRVRSSKFPNSIAGVVYQPGAFTAVSDGQINLAPNEEAKRAAKDALNGMDPTGNALYYWNASTATSNWIKQLPITSKIGKHSFSKG